MNNEKLNQIIALAGLFQAATMVKQIAHQGSTDTNAFESSIGSILKVDTTSVEAVYGSTATLKLGLKALVDQLQGSRHKRDMEITKYVVTLLHLERKLAKKSSMLEQIRQGIDQAEQQLDHFELTHSNIIARLADTYLCTLSTLRPRIMVNGEQAYLGNPKVANKIRASLLAGIRAAHLWRQCGGNRFQLLVRRATFAEGAEKLLDNMEQNNSGSSQDLHE